MTARHDLDRQLDAFLLDGPLELPDPSFDSVRDRMETTRQRAVIGPWRVPDMNKLIPIGAGVAALVLAVVVGARLLGPVSSGPGATAPPTATPSAVAGLPLGSFQLWRSGTPITVTIPASGWSGQVGDGIVVKNDNADPPDGAA